MKKFDFKKNYNYGIKAPLNTIVVFFFKTIFFHFQKKLQVLADPVVVNFFEIDLIQHFWHILKKITLTGSSPNFLSPNSNGQGLCLQLFSYLVFNKSRTWNCFCFYLICKTCRTISGSQLGHIYCSDYIVGFLNGVDCKQSLSCGFDI